MGCIFVSSTTLNPISSPSGLCPDWDQWDQSKPVDNAREAMQQADDWLGIPQVSGDQFRQMISPGKP